jgi:hypothetical protein
MGDCCTLLTTGFESLIFFRHAIILATIASESSISLLILFNLHRVVIALFEIV